MWIHKWRWSFLLSFYLLNSGAILGNIILGISNYRFSSFALVVFFDQQENDARFCLLVTTPTKARTGNLIFWWVYLVLKKNQINLILRSTRWNEFLLEFWKDSSYQFMAKRIGALSYYLSGRCPLIGCEVGIYMNEKGLGRYWGIENKVEG